MGNWRWVVATRNINHRSRHARDHSLDVVPIVVDSLRWASASSHSAQYSGNIIARAITLPWRLRSPSNFPAFQAFLNSSRLMPKFFRARFSCISAVLFCGEHASLRQVFVSNLRRLCEHDISSSWIQTDLTRIPCRETRRARTAAILPPSTRHRRNRRSSGGFRKKLIDVLHSSTNVLSASNGPVCVGEDAGRTYRARMKQGKWLDAGSTGNYCQRNRDGGACPGAK